MNEDVDSSIEVDRMEYRRLTREMDGFWRDASVASGLSDTSFFILFSICSEEKDFTQSELCKNYCFSKQTINSSVKALEVSGLIEMKAAEGRKKILCLTQKGKDFCEAKVLPVMKAEQDSLSAFTQEERKQFLFLMKKQLEYLKSKEEELWKN